MHLKTLSARNFRGFGSAPIDLAIGSYLVLFYGPNGYGKTSLAEAIEWSSTEQRNAANEEKHSAERNTRVHIATCTAVALLR